MSMTRTAMNDKIAQLPLETTSRTRRGTRNLDCELLEDRRSTEPCKKSASVTSGILTWREVTCGHAVASDGLISTGQ